MSGWDCVRAAKCRSDWTGNELIAYNIEIATETTEQFFGAASVGVSLAHLDPLIIAGFADTENLSDATLRYLTHLDHAVHASQESLIDEFSRQTLDLLGYSERGLTLYTRYNIPLTICGEDKNSQTDVCLVNGQTMILLILQKDKTAFNSSNPGPQVIAEAIAAYQYNNDKRERMGMAALGEMVFPCITMAGTSPTFYLVPVNWALSNAVITGQYATAPTVVRKCVTTAGHNRCLSEGMDRPKYRRVALQHFMAFKTLAKSHWENFLV